MDKKWQPQAPKHCYITKTISRYSMFVCVISELKRHRDVQEKEEARDIGTNQL